MYAILRFLANFVWYAALSVVVFLAAYVALGRQFFPAISLYQDEIEAFIQTQTGIRLDIQEVRGRWDGLNPVVEFISIAGLDEQGSVSGGVVVGSLSVELAVIESLTSGQIKIDDLRVSNVQILASQQSNGQWHLAGLPEQADSLAKDVETASPLSTLLAQYLLQPYLEISNIDVSLVARSGQTFAWKIPQAQLAYKNNHFSARGEIIAPETDEKFARFSIEGRGRLSSDDFFGKLYLEWQTGHFLNQYLEAYNWQGLEVAKLEASGKAWVEFSQGKLSSIFSSVAIPVFQLRTANQSLIPAQDVAFDVHWQTSVDASKLTISGLDFDWQGMQWGKESYVWHQTPASSWVRGSGVNLSILTPMLLSTGILSDEAVTNLAGYHPLGEIKNVELLLTETAKEGSEKATDFSFKANLQEVSVSAYDGAPSGVGVNGYIEANNKGGKVQFASNTFEMGFPTLFLEPWKFRYAEGVVKWDVSRPVTEIFSEGLLLDYSEGGRVLGDFRFSLPETPYDRYLSLSIAPFGLPATATTKFLPYHVVSKGLYDWLDHAVVAGVVRQGLYVGHGPVGDGDPEGLFESAMYFDVEQGEINFDDEWPNVTNYQGRISVDPNLLRVGVDQGNLGTLNIAGATIQKNLFSEGEDGQAIAHSIEVDMRTQLSGADAAYAMSSLPIKEYTGEVARSVAIDGAVGLLLDLDLFLEPGMSNSERVVVSFPGVNVNIPEANVSLEGVTGDLVYTSSSGIDGNLGLVAFGKPGRLIARTVKQKDSFSTQVLLNGAASLDALTYWLGVESPPKMAGGIDFTALLEVTSGAKGSIASLDIRSDLIGLHSEWPSMLGKEKASELPFHYRKLLHQSEEAEGGLCYRAKFKIEDCFFLGSWLSGWRYLDEDGNESVSLGVNARNASLADQPGVWLFGKLQQLDVDVWTSFFESLGDGISDAHTDAPKPFRGGSILVEELNAFGQHFKETQVSFDAPDTGYHLTFNGQGLAGDISLPDDTNSPIDIDLKKLTIQLKKDNAVVLPFAPEDDLQKIMQDSQQAVMQAIAEAPEVSAANLEDWRDMRIRINNLRVDAIQFDTLAMDIDVNSAESVVNIFPFKLTAEDDVVEGRLKWQLDSENTSVSRTIFSGKVSATETGDRWRKMGHTPSLNSKLGSLDYSLTWPGSPLDFSLERLSGRLVLALTDGKINEPNSSSNVLRLFGILNLDALSRRLRLDFTDLTDRGISFDTLNAVGSIENGLLTLAEPLVIQGPSNVFKFTGKTDLVAETLDLNMVVILPLTQNLPLAALFVGAPAVGGGLWVIDKLLGDPLSKITSATYYVKGSWDTPAITLKSMFDNTSISVGAKTDSVSPPVKRAVNKD